MQAFLFVHFLMTRQVVQSNCIVLEDMLSLLSKVSLHATKASNQLLSQLKLELQQRVSSSGRYGTEGETLRNECISDRYI